MKLNRLILISIFLLAIISLGAASATDDLNTEIGGGQNADDIQAAPVSEDITQGTQTDDDTSVLENDGGDVQTASQTYVITNETVSTYFGSDGKLVDTVEEGSTLDFQGTITSDNIQTLYINKTVNILSSTNDGFIDLNTSTGAQNSKTYLINCFILDEGASGTVLSGITFHNTQILLLDNLHNVIFDNVNVIAENISMVDANLDRNWKESVGILTAYAGCDNITIKNSNFYANNVNITGCRIADPYNCNIFNNTFTVVSSGSRYPLFLVKANTITEGDVWIYNNTFNGDVNYIVNTCHDSFFENNTVNMQLTAITKTNVKNCSVITFVNSGTNVNVQNCTIGTVKSSSKSLTISDSIIDTATFSAADCLINNSNVATITFSENSKIIKSVINDITISSSKGAQVTNCTINGNIKTTTRATKITINHNIINGNIISQQKIAEITNNTIFGYIELKGSADETKLINNTIEGYINITTSGSKANIVNNTIRSSQDYAINSLSPSAVIQDNNLYSGRYWGDHAVSGLGNISGNVPAQKEITISAENITYGNESTVVVYIENVEGNVTLKIADVEIPLTLVGGYATFKVNNTLYNVGDNNVYVSYKDEANKIYAANETNFNVAKINNYVMELKCVNGTECEKTTITLILPEYANGTALISLYNEIYSLMVLKNVVAGENVIEVPGLFEGNYNVTATFSSDIFEVNSTKSVISFVKAVKPTPKPVVKEVPTLKAAKKTVTIKKSAKKLVLKATLKINGKAKKGLKVKFTLNKKTYTGKTDAKGNVKVTIKKSALKKLKAGKKYTATIKYAKKTAKTTVKVKK